MSAPTGNTYAEKWTFDRTFSTLRNIDTLSRGDQYIYLGSALSAAGLYEDVWRYWRRKWSKCYEIIDLMKTIMQRFEVKIFEKMAKKEMPANVGMFALKHHYGWGKEPTPEAMMEDLNYVDKDPVHDLRSEPGANFFAPVQEPVKKQIELPEDDEDILLSDEEMAIVRDRYNQQNPQNPLAHPLPFFYGPIPADFEAIPFENGFFWNEPEEFCL